VSFREGAPTRRRAPAALALLALAVPAVAGCGSSSTTSSATSAPAAASSTPAASTPAAAGTTTSSGAAATGASSALSVAADPTELKYDKSTLTAKAGTVTIAFTNTSALSHNLTVESASGSVLGSTPTFTGGAKTLTLHLPAGTYKFFCTVPGHRAAGMEGTLTVQ
jgi:plastocyanin